MTEELPNVSSFLLRNSTRLQSSSLMSDQIILTFQPNLSVHDVLDAMADLITLHPPKRAQMVWDENTIRLEW